MTHQLPARGVLEHEEDAPLVVEPVVEAQDARPPQVAVHLDLAAHVDLGPLARDLRLVEHLERADEAGPAVSHEVDAPELALAERPANLELAQVEAAPWAAMDGVLRL